MTSERLISMDEVLKHNTIEDCWIVFYDKVYDLSSFLPFHPGGIPILAAHAGKVGTAFFQQVHPKNMFSILPKGAYLGKIDTTTIKPERGDVSKIGGDKTANIPSKL
eukprot:662375_1